MSIPFDALSGALTSRLQGFGQRESPFRADEGAFVAGSPFGAANFGGAQFSDSPFGSGQSPFAASPFGQGAAFSAAPFGTGQSPFAASPFGVGATFNASPFAQGPAFNQTPFNSGFNPYTYKPPGSADTGGGDVYGVGGTVDTGAMKVDATSATAWVQQKRPGSPIAPYTDFLVQYAKSKNVNPALILALMLKETQLGTDGSPPTRVNNWGNVGPGRSYATPQEGIKAMVDAIASYGTQDIPTIIGKYYAGGERWDKYGLAATDMGDGSAPSPNGTVQDYLNNFIYPTMLYFGAKYKGAATGGTGNWQGRLAQARLVTAPYTSTGVRTSGNPKDGFDCSSFTGYVLNLPRNLWNAQAQYDYARKISSAEAKPGDLVFFDIKNDGDASARPVGHVALYLGNGIIMQSTSGGGQSGIRLTDMNSPQGAYYKQHIYGWGRV